MTTRNAMAKAALEAARFTTASGHARTNCPFCLLRVGKDDKTQCLAISVTTGWYSCWRCGIKGKLDDGDFTPVEQAAVVEKVALTLPEGFYELGVWPGLTAESFRAERAYLRKRLPDMRVWTAARIGAAATGRAAERVIVPVLGPAGEVWGWVGRDVTVRAEKKYLNCTGMTVGTDGHLFNHAALAVKTDVPLLVMEGVFDALTYWPDAVAVLGSPTSAQTEALAKATRPVVAALDADAWDKCWVLGQKLKFKGQRAGAVRLPPGCDPDEVDPMWLRREAELSL